jgi:hypothetical protein
MLIVIVGVKRILSPPNLSNNPNFTEQLNLMFTVNLEIESTLLTTETNPMILELGLDNLKTPTKLPTTLPVLTTTLLEDLHQQSNQCRENIN